MKSDAVEVRRQLQEALNKSESDAAAAGVAAGEVERLTGVVAEHVAQVEKLNG